jgi:hypothetical protein
MPRTSKVLVYMVVCWLHASGQCGLLVHRSTAQALQAMSHEYGAPSRGISKPHPALASRWCDGCDARLTCDDASTMGPFCGELNIQKFHDDHFALILWHLMTSRIFCGAGWTLSISLLWAILSCDTATTKKTSNSVQLPAQIPWPRVPGIVTPSVMPSRLPHGGACAKMVEACRI